MSFPHLTSLKSGNNLQDLVQEPNFHLFQPFETNQARYAGLNINRYQVAVSTQLDQIATAPDTSISYLHAVTQPDNGYLQSWISI